MYLRHRGSVLNPSVLGVLDEYSSQADGARMRKQSLQSSEKLHLVSTTLFESFWVKDDHPDGLICLLLFPSLYRFPTGNSISERSQMGGLCAEWLVGGKSMSY